MTEEVIAIKEKGNACLKSGQHEEAILHYSHAIKLDPKNYSLYSNRSLAFLEIQQYYLAFEDAKKTIRLRPDWAKGYFRKAEVEFQTFNFSDALLSYKIALTLQPNDPSLEEAVKKTKAAIRKEKASDNQIPWLGAAIGIFVGALIVVSDQIFTHKPTLGNPLVMVLITVGVAVVGYLIARGLRHHVKMQRISLLDPPINLLQDKLENENDANTDKSKDMKRRYSKAQARQRFKKGKS